MISFPYYKTPWPKLFCKEGLQIEQDPFCVLFGTEDQKEGMAAFMEKRKAVFKGR